MSTPTSDIFTNDKDWLREQPGMEPWADGCRMLERILDSILDDNREKLFNKPVDAEHPLRCEYFARLWSCLFYHWHKRLETEVDADARQVVDDIKSQYRENNVFDHVALAAATVRNEHKAYILFYDLYCDIFRKIATRRKMLRVDIENSATDHEEANQDDCRESVLDKLIGPPEKETSLRVKNARLENYRGRGSFLRWLYTAVDRRISSYFVHPDNRNRDADGKNDDFIYRYSTHRNALNSPDETGSDLLRCEEMNRLHEVVKTLSEKEQQLIDLHYYEGWTYEEIGRFLSVNKSTVCRHLEEIRDRIRKRWNTDDME